MNSPSPSGRCKCGWQQPDAIRAWFVAETENWEPSDKIEMTMLIVCPSCKREITSPPVRIAIHAKTQIEKNEEPS